MTKSNSDFFRVSEVADNNILDYGAKDEIRDAHFPTGNRETGNQGPGNFPREMEGREKSGNREKMLIFVAKKNPKEYQKCFLEITYYIHNRIMTL